LVVNSIFVAATSFLSYIIERSLLGNSSTALFASALYLLNFAVSNGQLAALVDSGEALFLMALVVSMFYGRWLLLPLFGALGALTAWQGQAVCHSHPPSKTASIPSRRDVC
jgi:4-amino-4-deoxy-L-arabinose transferase-like glycosyltransferase